MYNLQIKFYEPKKHSCCLLMNREILDNLLSIIAKFQRQIEWTAHHYNTVISKSETFGDKLLQEIHFLKPQNFKAFSGFEKHGHHLFKQPLTDVQCIL